MNKFYPTREESALCVSCWFARMRTDVCGVYCTSGFVKNGECQYYESYSTHKTKRKRSDCNCKRNPTSE